MILLQGTVSPEPVLSNKKQTRCYYDSAYVLSPDYTVCHLPSIVTQGTSQELFLFWLQITCC